MDAREWNDVLLTSAPAPTAWTRVFARLCDLAVGSADPTALHHATVAPDRLLAEGAWELWQAYPQAAVRTSQELLSWCGQPSGPGGAAVLILDAFALFHLPALLAGARAHGIEPVAVRVTGAECPSDTSAFACALGVPQRSALAVGGPPPAGFALFGAKCVTDVLNCPFEDCLGAVPPAANLVLWHSWLDDLVHVHKKSPEAVHGTARAVLASDGFWSFVDRLRQGRRLVITADHGYAVSHWFSSALKDEGTIEALRNAFGASRCIPATSPWSYRSMPPAVCTANGFHVVMGQCKWPVQGGFPAVCHGGLSLLEVAVPWVELPPL